MNKDEFLVKRKVFLIWQHEQEEEWLTLMSAKGWQLVKVGFCKYTFIKDNSKQFVFRLDYQPLSKKQEIQEYIDFYQDTGCEYVGNLTNWYYFRKEADGSGKFEIYTDDSSKQAFYKRIRSVLLIVFLANLSIFFSNSMQILGRRSMESHSIANSMLVVSIIQIACLLLLGYCIYWLSQKIKLLGA